MVAYCALFTTPDVVLMAAVMTLGITSALTVYAWTTDTDFTGWGGFLWVFLVTVILFGIFAIISDIPILLQFYSALCCLLFGLYIIYDTQLIVGGKQFQLSEDAYIIGALNLYIDVIMLFIHLMEILNN